MLCGEERHWSHVPAPTLSWAQVTHALITSDTTILCHTCHITEKLMGTLESNVSCESGWSVQLDAPHLVLAATVLPLVTTATPLHYTHWISVIATH